MTKPLVAMEWIHSVTGHGKGPCDYVVGPLKHHATKQSFQPKCSCNSEFQRFYMRSAVIHIPILLSNKDVEEFPTAEN